MSCGFRIWKTVGGFERRHAIVKFESMLVKAYAILCVRRMLPKHIGGSFAVQIADIGGRDQNA